MHGINEFRAVVISPVTQSNYAHKHQCSRLSEWKWGTAVVGVSRVDGYSAVAATVPCVLWLSATLCQLGRYDSNATQFCATGHTDNDWSLSCDIAEERLVLSFTITQSLSLSSCSSPFFHVLWPPSVLSFYYFLLFFQFLYFVSFPSLYSVRLFCLLLVVPCSSIFYHVFLSDFSLLGTFASLRRL